jgi:hypothetical protein
VKEDETGGACSTNDMRNIYRILVGKFEGKKPPGRLMHRWEDNIRMDLREMRSEGVDWIHLSQDRDK